MEVVGHDNERDDIDAERLARCLDLVSENVIGPSWMQMPNLPIDPLGDVP
jgi:hypothetical protein